MTRVDFPHPDDPTSTTVSRSCRFSFAIASSSSREENPALGWRAIRVCLDEPELFQNQLRAAVRAAEHGNVRLLIPLVISADELIRTREQLDAVYREMLWDRFQANSQCRGKSYSLYRWTPPTGPA